MTHCCQNPVAWPQGLAGAQPHSEASPGALDSVEQVPSAPAGPGDFHRLGVPSQFPSLLPRGHRPLPL